MDIRLKKEVKEAAYCFFSKCTSLLLFFQSAPVYLLGNQPYNSLEHTILSANSEWLCHDRLPRGVCFQAVMPPTRHWQLLLLTTDNLRQHLWLAAPESCHFIHRCLQRQSAVAQLFEVPQNTTGHFLFPWRQDWMEHDLVFAQQLTRLLDSCNRPGNGCLTPW